MLTFNMYSGRFVIVSHPLSFRKNKSKVERKSTESSETLNAKLKTLNLTFLCDLIDDCETEISC